MGMTSQAAGAMSSLKLLQRNAFESPLDLETELQQSFSSLQTLLTPPYNVSLSSTDAPVAQALLYAILTNPIPAATTYLHHLTAVTGDGYASFVSLLLRLVNECYLKLLDQPRNQVLWLLRQLITFNAAELDNLCIALLRQVAGGDLSGGNVWLATELLDVMQTYEQWIYEKPHLFTMALYTYLRLLPDHAMGKTSALNDLKQKEIIFCIKILRERFQDCLVIGRDLIRLLQDVALLPEFELLWRDLLSNPVAFKALGFTDIGQLYVVRTPTRYLASRITPDMEVQIKFMLTNVRMGSQRRYQTWFAQRYLSTAESETLVCDLIRFICCVIHPTNQILQSDIVPRWALVGWLLKCCKSNHVEANAKLALFYDWLFFMTKTDNIMNIEPAILLMVHSIPKYVDMTHSLLEFLFLLVENYDPARRDLILKGVTASIDILVGKGVVHSLEPLSASHLVSPGLREKLNIHFPSYCKPNTGEGPRQFKHEPQDGFLMSKGNGMGSYGAVSVPFPSVGGTANGDTFQTPIAETSSSTLEEPKQTDGTDIGSKKRRRAGTSETLLSEVQAHVDGLAEAMTQSNENAVAALEKLLASFLSASDQMSSVKLAKFESPLNSDTGLDPSTTNHSPDLFSSSSLTILKFATQVVNILKKGGYEMFGPLTKLPSEKPDGDETMSLTSTLLHLYVVNNHPQLRQLLVAWHHEGLAVGPRLLCYVSRLAEELEPPVSGSLGLKMDTGGAEVEKLVGLYSQMQEEDTNTGRIMINSETDEDGKVIGTSSKASQEHSKNGEGGPPSGWPRCVDSNLGGNRRILWSKDVAPQSTVADAFKSYGDFLLQTSKEIVTLPQAELLNPTSNHNSDDGDISQIVKLESVAGESLELALLTHLETCFVWNAQRLLRVLPSVFRYLPHLAIGKEAIVLLLVSTVDPVVLLDYEIRLTLREFAVMGEEVESLAHVIKVSLSWESLEQQYFWRLMGAELQSGSPSTALQVVESSLAVVNPQVHADALSGLILLLRSQPPTGGLLSAVLSLPPKFGRFVAIALAGWVSSHYTLLLSCLQQLSANSSTKDGRGRKSEDNGESNLNKSGLRRLEKMNSATMAAFLGAFEEAENGRIAADEKSALRTREIKHALLKLVGTGMYGGARGVVPSQSPVEKAADKP